MAKKKTVKKNPGCLLGRWPDGTATCCVSELQCVRCGWTPEVDRRRRLENRRKFGLGT